MSASGSREGLRLFTIFLPNDEGDPIVHKERNCSPPVTIAPGQYRTFSPDQFVDDGQISITARSTTPAGDNRYVSVVTSLIGPVPQTTQIDIYLKDETGAPTDDSGLVECTFDAMPL